MHYRVWDSIVDGDDGDRIDYHGARLHAVIASPVGNPAAQIERAVALARKLTEAARKVGDAHGFPSRIRFGIDHGKCLAMTTGRGAHEKDTLFLGRPANHAAKLVASSSEQGIFLTDTAQKRVAAGAIQKRAGTMTLDEAYVETAARKYAFDSLDRTASAVATDFSEPMFRFKRPTLPLSTVKFSELSPANSIRMGMASIFADIDGFTNFVDQSILGGSEKIREAVKVVHVIREELNSVLKEDFGGKRVRFIGDCIHGCVAEGERADDAAKSVREAVLCASAMRSSFDLCLETVRSDAADRSGGRHRIRPDPVDPTGPPRRRRRPLRRQPRHDRRRTDAAGHRTWRRAPGRGRGRRRRPSRPQALLGRPADVIRLRLGPALDGASTRGADSP